MFLRIVKKVAFVCAAIVLFMPSVARAQGPMSRLTSEHKAIAAEAGVWDAQSKFWMAPDTQPMISNAVETNTILGGMWLVSDYRGDMGGMTFVGHGQFGYDPVAKKYIGTWIDTMSPYLSVMEGTRDPATQTLTMISKGRDARTGKESISKMVSKFKDEDHKTFEMYSPVAGQEGQWWKMMEIEYTRRK